MLQRGFTLIELLIVVIILAILAAIIIPQFSGATADAQESALDANLNALRSAIEVYKTQHNGDYPGSKTAISGTVCTGGATGTGDASDAGKKAQAFMDQLQMASTAAGLTCSIPGGDYKYGPYVRKGIPTDSITQPSKGSLVGDIAVTTAGTPLAPAVTTGGWAYDTVSGQIVMNSNAKDSKTIEYYKH